MQNFRDDIDVVMSEVHAALEHWGLVEWREYLIVRRPDKLESYFISAHPADRSDFDEKLVGLHKQEVLRHIEQLTTATGGKEPGGEE